MPRRVWRRINVAWFFRERSFATEYTREPTWCRRPRALETPLNFTVAAKGQIRARLRLSDRGLESEFLFGIRAADNGPRVPLQTFSPGGCSTSGHNGKKNLAFGLLNCSPVWPFLRQKLLNRFDHSLPHRKSTSALPPAADVKGCTSLSPGLTRCRPNA